MDEEGGAAVSRGERLVARVERFYLMALRVALLLLATALLLYALWLAGSGLYHWSRNPASVKEAPVEVTAQEVATVPAETPARDAVTGDSAGEGRTWYRGFLDRYQRLYADRYERFRQAADVRLTRAQFDDRFVGTTRRIEAIGAGELSFASDRARLERLLTTMTQVASLPETVQRLRRYRNAKRVKVSRVVRGTRPERYCSYFGYYINECLTYDTRQVPFSRTVTETRLPAGVLEPAALFGRQQDRFLELLAARADSNAATANAERARLAEGNLAGSARLWTALSVVGAFLAVMFLFLLIAIERHQRRLALLIGSDRTQQ